MSKRKEPAHKKRGKRHVHKPMTALLAAALSVGPAFYSLGAAEAQAAPPVTLLPIKDITGVPGETFSLNLADYFGPGNETSTFNVVATNSEIVKKAQFGSKLELYLDHPGMTTFTVTLGSGTVSESFNVRVIDPGADGKLDVIDLVRFMNNNPGAITSRDGATGVLNKVEPAVSKVNHAPTPNTFQFQIPYSGSQALVRLAQIFRDPDGDSLTFQAEPVIPGGEGVTASVTGNELTFTGDLIAGTAGATFRITATDSAGLSAVQFLTLVPNHNPQTVATATYSVYAPLGTVPAPINLSPFFMDPDGDPITYSVTPPVNGGVTASVYGSTLTFSGVMSNNPTEFSVWARDNKGGYSNPFLVILNPNSTAPTGNHTPTVTQQTYGLVYRQGDMVHPINLASNFSDPDGDALSYSLSAFNSGGLNPSISGSMLSFTGKLLSDAFFVVKADDNRGGKITATYQITATPNNSPTVSQQVYSFDYPVGTTKLPTFELGQLFNDPDGDPLQYSYTTSDDGGLIPTIIGSTLSFGGQLERNASIIVSATDGRYGFASAYFYFNAAAVNHAPTVTQQTYGFTYPQGDFVQLSFDLSENFKDLDGDALQFTITSSSTAGDISPELNGSNLSFTGKLNSDVTFTVTAYDGKGGTAEAYYYFNAQAPANHAPTAVQQVFSFTSKQGSYVESIDLSGNFTDLDNDRLEYSVTPQLPSGFNPIVSGSLLMFNEKMPSDATFTVTASDGHGGTAQAEYHIIAELNHAPTVMEPNYNYTYLSGSRVNSIDLANDFADSDGDQLQYSYTTTDAGGLYPEISGSMLLLGGQLDRDATFIVTAEDGQGGSMKANYNFKVNHAPTVTEATYNLTYLIGSAVNSVDLSHFFTDPDGDQLEYSYTTMDAGGLNPQISGSMLLLGGQLERDATFIVTADDNRGGTMKATYNFKVNHAPTVTHQTYGGLMFNEGSINASIDVSGNFNDLDGDTLEYKVTPDTSADVTATISGSVLSFGGTLHSGTTFTVKASDGRGGVVSADYPIAVNHAPTVTNAEIVGEYRLGSGTSAAIQTPSFDLSGNFQDADLDAWDHLTFNVTPSSTNTLETVVRNGVLSFAGMPSGSPVLTYTVTATDLMGLSSSATYTLNPKVNQNPSVTENVYHLTYPAASEGLVTIPETSINLLDNFSDADHDALNFTLATEGSVIPEGLTAFVSGSNLIYSGSIEAWETPRFLIVAEDELKGKVEATYVLESSDGNHKPVVASGLTFEYSTGEGYMDFYENIDNYVSDLDNDSLTFTINQSKTSPDILQKAAIVSGSFLSVWGYMQGHFGNYTVAVDVQDSKGATTTLSINLLAPNHAPGVEDSNPHVTFIDKNDTSTLESVFLDYNFYDEDEEAITYTIDEANSILPSGYKVNINEFNELELKKVDGYVPQATDVISVRVVAKDGRGETVSANYTFQYDRAPQVLASSYAVQADAQDFTLDLYQLCEDPDKGDEFNIQASIVDSGAGWISLDSEVSTLLHFGTPSGSMPASVNFTVTDSHGLTASKTVTFTPSDTAALTPKDKSIGIGTQLTLKDMYKRYSNLNASTKFTASTSYDSNVFAITSEDWKDLTFESYYYSGVSNVVIVGSDTLGNQGVIDILKITADYPITSGSTVTVNNPFNETNELSSLTTEVLDYYGVGITADVTQSTQPGALDVNVHNPSQGYAPAQIIIKSQFNDGSGEATIYQFYYQPQLN
ncbi:Ig-like domain-containing protein [Paenibacillus cremeus]|uniref:Tandem-95 repeat protein n=1 Tax=Paenibacillus cremeus TaxID=2163881 RepID=A0A559KEB6_9BACL|nr:hypothetical protein [Paenibacillus cremeus]TVY10464.1 hypothetical protein FPZ49_08715 [Paenibacillus cremeus]